MCSKAFTASTFAWLRLVKADGDLTALAVAVQLIEHFNEAEGGVARAGTRYIAGQLGLSHPTVSRALHRLVDRGRLRIEWGEQGRGHANRCWMVVGEGVNKRYAREPFGAAEKVQKKVHQRSQKGSPAQQNHCKNHKGDAKASLPYGEREQQPLAVYDLLGGAGDPLTGAAPVLASQEVDTQEELELEAAEPEPPRPAKPNPNNSGDGFCELRRLWVRPWVDADDDQAAKLYAKARAEVGPTVVLKAAEAWVAAGDAPRFLPTLSKWLAGRGWEKPPPAKKPRTATKRGKGQRYSGYNGGKPDMARMMLALVGEEA